MYKTSAFRINNDHLIRLEQSSLGNRESALQQWIWEDPSLLGEPIALLGREVIAGSGRRIDLVGIDRNCQVCVIELKRDKTPREVVAQTLDYASWVASMSWQKLEAAVFPSSEKTIAQCYESVFGIPPNLDDGPEPRMIIVASKLDDASERITRFLTDRGIAINALFFTTFQDGSQQILASSWLMDLEDAEERTALAVKKKPIQHPPSGFWFVNVGAPNASTHKPIIGEPSRSWADNRNFGFISFNGGPKYLKMLGHIPVGGKIFAWLNGAGYVGYGELRREAVPIQEFLGKNGETLPPSQLERPELLALNADPLVAEYAIGVDWIKTVDASAAIVAWHSVLTACALNKPEALEVLQAAFADDPSASCATSRGAR